MAEGFWLLWGGFSDVYHFSVMETLFMHLHISKGDVRGHVPRKFQVKWRVMIRPSSNKKKKKKSITINLDSKYKQT